MMKKQIAEGVTVCIAVPGMLVWMVWLIIWIMRDSSWFEWSVAHAGQVAFSGFIALLFAGVIVGQLDPDQLGGNARKPK